MQKTKKQMQEEYTKELNEWITRCEKYSTEKDSLTESLSDVKKIVCKKNDELFKLKKEKKQMQKQMNEWVSKQVARLEAVKMLWSIMDSGGSHRQKRLFMNQATIILQSEINELKRGVIVNSDELPF